MAQREIGLNERELKRHGVLERLRAGAVSQVEAARELGLSARQVRRLQRRLEAVGPAGLRYARRGKKPNNWIDEERREAAAALIRERYGDFGPTLAREMLLERHGLAFSVETTRTLMREAGLWRAKRRSVRFHPPRARRPRLGELVQIDGSPQIGSKVGQRAAPCWSLSMTPPAAFRQRASWQRKRQPPITDCGPGRYCRFTCHANRHRIGPCRRRKSYGALCCFVRLPMHAR